MTSYIIGGLVIIGIIYIYVTIKRLKDNKVKYKTSDMKCSRRQCDIKK